MLKQRYVRMSASCVTNDWIVHTLRAQKKFAHRYNLVRSPTLIFMAEKDVFVYNRAVKIFGLNCPSSR